MNERSGCPDRAEELAVCSDAGSSKAPRLEAGARPRARDSAGEPGVSSPGIRVVASADHSSRGIHRIQHCRRVWRREPARARPLSRHQHQVDSGAGGSAGAREGLRRTECLHVDDPRPERNRRSPHALRIAIESAHPRSALTVERHLAEPTTPHRKRSTWIPPESSFEVDRNGSKSSVPRSALTVVRCPPERRTPHGQLHTWFPPPPHRSLYNISPLSQPAPPTRPVPTRPALLPPRTDSPPTRGTAACAPGSPVRPASARRSA